MLVVPLKVQCVEFVPSSQLSHTPLFRVRITATVALMLQKANTSSTTSVFSVTATTQKRWSRVVPVRNLLTYFKTVYEYRASTPVHAHTNVKFEAYRNTYDRWWW